VLFPTQINLFYSCVDPATRKAAPDVYIAEVGDLPAPPSAPDVVIINDGNGHYLPMEALAWDPVEEHLWAVNRIPVSPSGTGVVSGVCAVWRLGPVGDETVPQGEWPQESAQLAFTFTDVAGGCDFFSDRPNSFDGLAVDPVSGSLYLSAAGGATIRHLNKDGTPATNDPIDFAALTAGVCGGPGCGSSGLLVGVNGNLLSATGETGKLVEIDPDGPSVVAVYDSGAGRDWGIACGPVHTLPDGSLTNTVLSADLYSANISLLEAPPGLCDSADYAFRNPVVLPGDVIVARLGQTAYGVFGGEYIGFGSEVAGAGPINVTMDLAVLDGGGFDNPRRIIAEPGDTLLGPAAVPPTGSPGTLCGRRHCHSGHRSAAVPALHRRLGLLRRSRQRRRRHRR
jgi:hypothetical protein